MSLDSLSTEGEYEEYTKVPSEADNSTIHKSTFCVADFRDGTYPPRFRFLLHIHGFTLGTLHALLAVLVTVMFIRLFFFLRIRRPFIIVIHLLLIAFAVFRTIFTVSQGYVSDLIFQVIGDLGIPALTSAYALVMWVMYEISQLRVRNPRLQSKALLISVIVGHFLFIIAVDIVVGNSKGTCWLLLVCQVFNTLWAIILTAIFVFVTRRIYLTSRELERVFRPRVYSKPMLDMMVTATGVVAMDTPRDGSLPVRTSLNSPELEDMEMMMARVQRQQQMYPCLVRVSSAPCRTTEAETYDLSSGDDASVTPSEEEIAPADGSGMNTANNLVDSSSVSVSIQLHDSNPNVEDLDLSYPTGDAEIENSCINDTYQRTESSPSPTDLRHGENSINPEGATNEVFSMADENQMQTSKKKTNHEGRTSETSGSACDSGVIPEHGAEKQSRPKSSNENRKLDQETESKKIRLNQIFSPVIRNSDDEVLFKEKPHSVPRSVSSPSPTPKPRIRPSQRDAPSTRNKPPVSPKTKTRLPSHQRLQTETYLEEPSKGTFTCLPDESNEDSPSITPRRQENIGRVAILTEQNNNCQDGDLNEEGPFDNLAMNKDIPMVSSRIQTPDTRTSQDTLSPDRNFPVLPKRTPPVSPKPKPRANQKPRIDTEPESPIHLKSRPAVLPRTPNPKPGRISIEVGLETKSSMNELHLNQIRHPLNVNNNNENDGDGEVFPEIVVTNENGTGKKMKQSFRQPPRGRLESTRRANPTRKLQIVGFSAVGLGTLNILLSLVGTAYIYNPIRVGSSNPSPEMWLLFVTFQRFLELAFALVLTFLAWQGRNT